MIRETRYCTSCGSTIIQGENDGCNMPRHYTCLICCNSRYSPMPKSFPKRLRIKEREFAVLYLKHQTEFWCPQEWIDAISLFLCVEEIGDNNVRRY